MNIDRKNFPLALKDKVLENVNKRKLNITFLNGAIIEPNNANIRFIEPYKIIFKSKSSNPTKYLVALVFDEELGSNLTIFINEIGEINKCSVSKLIKIVNENICL